MPETRLKRFTLSEASISVGVISGFYLGSLITSFLGNFYIFVICSILCIISLIYTLIRLENIIPVKEDFQENERRSCFSSVRTTLKAPFRKRKGHLRIKILLLCLIFLLQEAPWLLDDALMVLYTEEKFHWTATELLDFKTVFWILVNIGQFAFFPFLKRVLSLPLMIIGALTSVSRSCYYGLLAICSSSTCLYIAAFTNCLCGVQSIIVRSSLATELPPSELGTIFGILEIACSLVPFAVAPLASWVYNITVDVYPGTWALLSMGAATIQLPLFIAIYGLPVNALLKG